MSHGWSYALLLGAVVAGIASPQTISSDLQKYLNLTDTQVQSITDLDNQFSDYVNQQYTTYWTLQSQADNELAKPSPDPGSVGDSYAQIEMLRRDYKVQLAQVQSKVGAVLTMDQATVVSGLLNAVRLRPLVSEAECAHLEPAVPTAAEIVGNLSPSPGTTTISGVIFEPLTTGCHAPPILAALGNYLNLSDGQIIAMENAILANQDYVSRQALKITELQNEIKDLTAAPTVDSARLGADYVAISQIQSDESTQYNQLMTALRSILTDSQQPLLQALDNALKLSSTATDAVSANILVLPPDLQLSNCGLFDAVPVVYCVPTFTQASLKFQHGRTHGRNPIPAVFPSK